MRGQVYIGSRVRLLVVVALGALLLMAVFNQVLAWRRASLETAPHVVNDVPARTYAEAHWNSLASGNRGLFLSGFTTDALLVVVSDQKEEVVLLGIERIGAAWVDTLAAFRSSGVTIDIRHRSKEERRADADLFIPPIDSEAPTIHVHATLRLNGEGRIFEERLEILKETGTLGQN